MKMNVHYSTVTGEIISFGSSDEEDGADSHFANCKVMLITPRDDLGVGTHTVDLDTLELVAKPTVEIEYDPKPDLKRRILSELENTDKFMLLDFPISDSEKAEWVRYRKALRDCSKNGFALPVRPFQ